MRKDHVIEIILLREKVLFDLQNQFSDSLKEKDRGIFRNLKAEMILEALELRIKALDNAYNRESIKSFMEGKE